MEFIRNITAFYSSYLRPGFDVLLLAFLMYKAYQILLKTQAIQLIKGAMSILAIYAVAMIFKLETLLWILNTCPSMECIFDSMILYTAYHHLVS